VDDAERPAREPRHGLLLGYARRAMIVGVERLGDLDRAWGEPRHGTQLRAVKRAAAALREKLVDGPRVISVRTLPLTMYVYPTRYAFWSAASLPSPLVAMTHRCVLVQFFQRGEVKTLLFNPTDVDAARATPFFALLIDQMGTWLADRLSKRFEPLEVQLARLGLAPQDIDFIAYDHFHSQDLRGAVGTTDGTHSARFPNAKLLAPRSEWDEWDDLHPLQRAWFVRDGKLGVRMENVVLTTSDLTLGDGIVLLRTPGHTSGNQTLFLNTPNGIWGISENGTCADSWSPIESRIRGLSSFCKKHDLDVILNANTPELGALQYTSMVLERTLVDRVGRAPGFVQMFASSEVTPSVLAPGLVPTVAHPQLTYGEIVRPKPRVAREPMRIQATA
jgi:hypothetical protein